MDKGTLAQYIYNAAKKDMFNGKGRIIISDFRREMELPELSVKEIIEAFQQHYPQWKIEQRMNVILIHFG